MHIRGAKEELAILLPNTMPNYLPHHRLSAPEGGEAGWIVRMIAVLGVAMRRMAEAVRRRAVGGGAGRGAQTAAAGRESPSDNDRRFIGRTSAA